MKVLFISIAALFFSEIIGCQRSEGEMAIPQKYRSVATQCVGRNMIRLPQAFLPADIATGFFSPTTSLLEGLTFDVIVDSAELKRKPFSEHILERRAELSGSSGVTSNIFRLERPLSDVATIFRIQQIKKAYQSEAHFKIGENLVVVKIDSFNDTFLTAEEQLVKFMADFSAIDQDKVKGFCLGDLAIHGDYISESGDYGWSDDAGNTIDLQIDTFRSDSSKPLLQRTTGPDSLLNVFHIGHSVLRSGERTVAGMRAQEWLGWTKVGTEGDKKTFGFTMETMRPVPARKTPMITVALDSAQKLSNGVETKTNLSDEEAIAVWDAIIGSIQPIN